MGWQGDWTVFVQIVGYFRVELQGMDATEYDLLRECSQCYLLLQQYKLRTNLVGANLQKEQLEGSYAYLQERVTERYGRLFEELKQTVGKLQVTFRLAQANALRTLNNIFRNYRRRVGTLANEPLSSLKYGRFQRQEKLLLESLVYLERENLGEIGGFREELQKTLAAASHEVQEKYRRNPKIREDYRIVLDIIDKSECYTYKYYQGFQRSMLASVGALQSHFDKLNAFLSVWENVGSTKAYETRSAKEMESEDRTQEGVGRRFHEDESEEQLEDLMRGCPQHSPQREQYRKRLNDLRRFNAQKQKKLDMVGKMYGKRRNRAGILVSRNREVSLLELVINTDNSKVPFSHQDPFRHYKPDSEQADYRPTPYETHRPLKTAEEARQYLQKHRPTPPNQEWWYDRFGKEGTLDLMTCQSQMVQKRIQFQVVRQTELQNADDRRKRELLEKQNYQIKENERREGLHVGYRHIHDKTELETLMIRAYNVQYIPSLAPHNDISFSDDQGHISEVEEEDEHPQQLQQQALPIPTKTTPASKKQFPFLKMEQHRPLTVAQQEPTPQKDMKIQPLLPVEQVNVEMPLQQQIILTYFRQYSRKIIRKQQQPQYKKTQFFYFQSPSNIDWTLLESSYVRYQKIFIYTSKSILFFNKILSAQQQKMKCNVYSLQDDTTEEEEERSQKEIRKAVKYCFRHLSLVTVRFHSLYHDSADTTAFMMGLLMILLRQGKIEEDSDIKDFVNEGKEIIDDFNEYYYPTEDKNPKSLYMRRFMPQPTQETFAPKKQEKTQPILPNKPAISSSPQIAETKAPTQAVPVNKEADKNQPEKSVPKEAPIPTKKPEPQPKPQAEPTLQQPPFYQEMREQRELPRSNSRQYLGKFQLQLQLQEGQEGNSSGQEEDYEQL